MIQCRMNLIDFTFVDKEKEEDYKCEFLFYGDNYELSKDTNVKVRDIVYDNRMGDYYYIENEEDVLKYSFVAPELIEILRKVE